MENCSATEFGPKLKNAELLGEKAMLVTTSTLGLSEPETSIIWLNYVGSPVSATEYLRETNKSSNARLLMSIER